MDNILDDVPVLDGISSLIMVAGVGGAGGNAVDHMYRMGINGVNFVLCNTDRQALENSPVKRKIMLGDGLGAGNTPEVGEQKAKTALDEIRNCFKALDTKLLFLAAGMGGGTGTGASPVIAQLAREMGILTVAIVTMPPADEGPKRMEQAVRGLERLRAEVDSLIVLSNEAIDDLYGNMPLGKAFDKANDVLALAAKGIAEIVTTKSNLVNVDFADVCMVLRDSGCAVIGVSSAKGPDRAEQAVDASLVSPLFGGASIAGASNVLLNLSVSSPDALTANEARRARERVQHYASYVDGNGTTVNTNIIWGTSIKPDLDEDELEVIVVVTGFPSEYYNNVFTGKSYKAEPLRGVAVAAEPAQGSAVPTTEGTHEEPSSADAAVAPAAPAVNTPAPAPAPAAPAVERTGARIEIMQRPASFYRDLERRKSRPAYISRNTPLLSQSTARKRFIDRDDKEPAAPVVEQTPNLFDEA